MSSAGLQRVDIAQSTWFMLEGSTSSSTAMIHLEKYAPPGTCPARASACGAWPAYRCSSEIGRATRLNSSHGYISYAVFCLKKKKKQQQHASQRQRDTT